MAGGAKASGGGRGGAAAEVDEAPASKLAGKKKLIAIIAVVVIAAAAAYFFVIAPKKAAAAEHKEPVPGEVVALESTSLNLAGGHYLRIGIALQMVEGGGHGASTGPDGSHAKDLIISTFSGKKIETLNNAKEREHLKEELKEKIAEAYHQEVMDIYFTEFVTQ